MVARHFGGLWQHPDFLKLWAGLTVSLFGSFIGRFALPLVAVLTLDASPAEVALLQVAQMAPGIVVGLLAGAWVDRLRPRPILIGADLGRALLLLAIPALAALGALRVEHLYLVAALVGTLTTFFDVAYQAYLPALVGRAALVEGHSKLEASSAIVEVASFGVAGLLVQRLSAPLALLVDAASFVVSALALALIRTPDRPPAPADTRESTWREIEAGLCFVLGSPILRALAGAKSTRDFFVYAWASMLMLFLTRDLELAPAVFGALFAIGGLSALLGAVLAQRIVRRLGLGPTLILGLFLGSASLLCVPLAAGPLLLVVALVGAQQLFDAANTIYDINENSLIQTIAPDALLGRVAASMRFVGWGAMLGGTLVGGVLGEIIGPRATMLVAALGTLPAVLWLVYSPVLAMREPPLPPER